MSGQAVAVIDARAAQIEHYKAVRARIEARGIARDCEAKSPAPVTEPSVEPTVSAADLAIYRNSNPCLYPRIATVIAVCAHAFDVSVIDIISDRRQPCIVFPRHVAMYLAKQMTLKSYPEIGRRFGGRDHTTAYHAVRKIERLVASGDLNLSDLAAKILSREGLDAPAPEMWEAAE